MPRPSLRTNDDLSVELCTIEGVDHDYRPRDGLRVSRPYTYLACVWCGAVACGDIGEPDPCIEPYHHDGPHRSRAGLTWPLGGVRPGDPRV